MLLGPRVSVAPRCLALPHPAAAHQARLSPGPTRQSLRPRRSRLPPPLFAARPPRPRDVRRPLLSKRPRATTPMPCQLTWRRTPAPPPPLRSFSYPHATPSRPPPIPCLIPPLLKRESPDTATLSTLFLSLALLCARPSEPPLIHTGDRATAALSCTFPTAAIAAPPR
jgi:hypothetical protein